jgi:hypothetical protein
MLQVNTAHHRLILHLRALERSQLCVHFVVRFCLRVLFAFVVKFWCWCSPVVVANKNKVKGRIQTVDGFEGSF